MRMPRCKDAAVKKMAGQVPGHFFVSAAGLTAAGQALGYTVSIGVHVARTAATLEQVLTHADAALYQAKAAGRDRACMADSVEAVGARWKPSACRAAMG